MKCSASALAALPAALLVSLLLAGPAAALGDPPVISGLSVATGNLTGDTELTILVSNVQQAEGTIVRIGDQVAQILEVVPGVSVRVLTPPVSQSTGLASAVTVRTPDGTGVLPAAFTYTPTLSVQILGSAATGGGVVIHWVTESNVPPATVTVWLGHPAYPDFVATLPGYSGLIYEEPGLEFIVHAPAGGGPVLMHFPALPAALIGFPLDVQGLAHKEGAHKGSFTNPVTFAIF
ncbi:MAG: IPT/TIG domain-containing protein [Planctomycetota bacterium]